MMRRLIASGLLLTTLVLPAAAQRGGGGRGAGAGDGGGPTTLEFSRLEILTQAFKLTKDQRDKVRALFDAAHKDAAPIRDGLARSRAAITAAIQGGKGQSDVDQAVKDYAAQATAMTALEMTALGRVLKTLEPAQAANSAGVQNAFFMVRGMFLSKGKWDVIPDGSYRY